MRANLGRRAKIVATLGPVSSSEDIITEMILSGVNVTRVNMSHGTHETHDKLISTIRKASSSVGLEVAVLCDLQGPKIRVDALSFPLELGDDEEWGIGPTELKDEYPEFKDRYIPTVYKDLVKDCADGARIFFDDGLLIAKAVERIRDVYKIKIVCGGKLTSHKGINLPDSIVSAPSLSEKDRKDVLFAIAHEADYIALSFVRKAQDVIELRKFIKKNNGKQSIISKIESPEGVDNIDEIIEVSDAIMVARGDMGVELGNHLVPTIQKAIIHKCNTVGVPVITATQMLESMITNMTPTRAEASDVANAIWDGTDAVMLSGETASGKYPLETLQIMGELIHEAEKNPSPQLPFSDEKLDSTEKSIMYATATVAKTIKAKRILSVTQNGTTCKELSTFRPVTSILGISHNIRVVRKMSLFWGVSPFFLHEHEEDHEHLESYIIEQVKESCELNPSDKIVITRGSGDFFTRGGTNSLRVETIT